MTADSKYEPTITFVSGEGSPLAPTRRFAASLVRQLARSNPGCTFRVQCFRGDKANRLITLSIAGAVKVPVERESEALAVALTASCSVAVRIFVADASSCAPST